MYELILVIVVVVDEEDIYYVYIICEMLLKLIKAYSDYRTS